MTMRMLRPMFLALGLMFMVLSLTGCADNNKAEQLMTDLETEQNKIYDALKEFDDPNEIDDIMAQLEDVRTRMNELGEDHQDTRVTESTKERLLEEQKEFNETWQADVQKEIIRISLNPELQPLLEEKIAPKMEQIGQEMQGWASKNG